MIILPNLSSKFSPGLRRWLFPATFGLWTLRGVLLLIPLPGLAGLAQTGLDRLLDLGIPALLLFQILLLNSWRPRELIVAGLATALLGLSMLRSGATALVLVWVFLLASKDARLDDVVRVALPVQLGCLALTVGASLLGLTGNDPIYREELPRYALGYPHPNVLGMMVQQLMCCLVFGRGDRRRPWLAALCLGAAVFCWVVPNSRASVLVLVLLAGLCVLRGAPEKVLCRWLPPLAAGFALVTVLLSLTFRPEGLWYLVDEFFSNRLDLSHRAFEAYGLSALGTPLPAFHTFTQLNGQPFYMPWIDSSYMYLLLRYGVLAFLLWTGLYFGAMVCLARQKQFVLLGILTIYALHATMEPTLLELRKNLFLLAVPMALCRTAPLPREGISKTS